MRRLASKWVTQRLFLLAVLCVAYPLTAQQATTRVPAPQGLIPCPTNSPLISGITHMIGQAGTLDGCFISPERIQIQGSTKAVDQPLQYAFAITLPSNASGPFTTTDVDALYSKTQAQWSQVSPMWAQYEPTYEKYVKELIERSHANGTPQPNMTISRPALVTIERISPSAYIIVSVRQRRMTVNGNTVSPIAANGYALILSQGTLTRLTLERQMRSSADVDAVKAEILAWVRSVQVSEK